jgi:8-oxo-dGTP pyrophosphatase MutT (NUDIX family)
MVEDGENPAQSARRELAEETGIRAAEFAFVGSFVPMPSSTQRLHVFKATGLALGEPELTSGELAQGLRLEWWPLDKALEAVWDGQVQLSGSALALLAYTARCAPARPVSGGW